MWILSDVSWSVFISHATEIKPWNINWTTVYRGERLWNSTKFFVVCFCSVFWPWPCTKQNSCLLRTEEPTNRNVLVTQFKHSAWVQILASLFAALMFAGLHNQSPLLTMTELSYKWTIIWTGRCYEMNLISNDICSCFKNGYFTVRYRKGSGLGLYSRPGEHFFPKNGPHG